jgi:hypothetical protein
MSLLPVLTDIMCWMLQEVLKLHWSGRLNLYPKQFCILENGSSKQSEQKENMRQDCFVDFVDPSGLKKHTLATFPGMLLWLNESLTRFHYPTLVP